MSSFIVVPQVSIHPSGITEFSYLHGYIPNKISRENLENNSTKGEMSQSARRRAKKSIHWVLYEANQIKKLVTFVTLTLPSKQQHSDNEIKKRCLNQFLVELRKKYKVANYIWKAELQKNQNLHFHLLIDSFINHAELRVMWNRIINKLGYVDRYSLKMQNKFKNGFVFDPTMKWFNKLTKKWQIFSHNQQLDMYLKGKVTNWTNPNSTDIRNLKKVGNIPAYIIKYIAKQIKDECPECKEVKEGENCKKCKRLKCDCNGVEIGCKCGKCGKLKYREIEGRLWFASGSACGRKNITTDVDGEIDDELRNLRSILPNDKVFIDEYFISYNVTIDELRKFGLKRLVEEFEIGYKKQLEPEPELDPVLEIKKEPEKIDININQAVNDFEQQKTLF